MTRECPEPFGEGLKPIKRWILLISTLLGGLLYIVCSVISNKGRSASVAKVSFNVVQRHSVAGVVFIYYQHPGNDQGRTNTSAPSINSVRLRLCSIESAVRAFRGNRSCSQWPLVNIYATEVGVIRSWLGRVGIRSEVNVIPLNLSEIFGGTPFEVWYQSGTYDKGPYVGNKVSDACRLAILYKHGGTYLDSDMLVVKGELLDLPNVSVPLENAISICNAMLKFPRGHQLLWRMMEEFVWDYQPKHWSANGPALLTKHVRRCQAHQMAYCGPAPITVLGRNVFHSVPWQSARPVFGAEGREIEEVVTPRTLAVHYWHRAIAGQGMACVPARSLLFRLIRTYCPGVLREYSGHFVCHGGPDVHTPHHATRSPHNTTRLPDNTAHTSHWNSTSYGTND